MQDRGGTKTAVPVHIRKRPAYDPWEVDAAAFRASLGVRAAPGLAYGPGARQKFDLFRPEGTARGLMVFVHGGYWMMRDRGDFSHLAAGALG